MTRLDDRQRRLFYGVPPKIHRASIVTPWAIHVSCHVLLTDLFLDACDQAAADVPEWRPKRIDSYAYRLIRGDDDELSLHAYGLAWDFFSTAPGVVPPGGVWTPQNALPAAFARAFEERGFTWGARWRRRDVPHIEWAGPPPAGRPAELHPVASTTTRTDPEEGTMIHDHLEPLDDHGNAEWFTGVPWAALKNVTACHPVRPHIDGMYAAGLAAQPVEDDGNVVVVITGGNPRTKARILMETIG